MRAAAGRIPEPAPFAPVLAALRDFAGLAPSPVLVNRLHRAAPLAERVASRAPRLDDPDWAALLDALTVPETRMFRSAPQLAAFRSQILPGLVARAGPGPLRLVSAGCATGEEAWTLALLAAGAAARWQVQGLDLSRPALQAAERARYHRGPPDALREVPEADRAWLRLDAERFEPAPALRDHVRFTHANLLEAAIAPAEAILCRNVLIYLTEPARAQVLGRLVAALRPGGVLLLGATDRPSPALGLRPVGGDGLGIWSRGDA